MRYYKIIKNNTLYAIGTGAGGIEITSDEYRTLSHEIDTKINLIEDLLAKKITIDSVPAEWQEEIQRRVDECIAAQGALDEQDISDSEALDIILGGEVE